MIGRVEGALVEKQPTRVLVDVGGVGYELSIPLSTFGRLPDEGKVVALRVHTHVRDDALLLFGFATEVERVAFELLIRASRVGPKLAQAILSGIEASDLLAAIRAEDVSALHSVPGVGAKTAERIVLELRDRVPDGFGESPPVGAIPSSESELRAQLLSALVNLQVTRAKAERVVEGVIDEHGEEAPIELLVRAALRRLAG